jgi:hypothetical protein
MIYVRVLLALVCFASTRSPVEALDLILEDIGPYKWGGGTYPATGILTGSGRLGNPADEHVNTTYRDRDRKIGVRVTVSRYADPTWALHELESGFRQQSLSALQPSAVIGGPGMRRLQYATAGLTVGGGGGVTWMSGEATLVRVEFTVSGPSRVPEVPQDVVDAYLSLYPSTLPALDSSAAQHSQWIRDEMRRILEYAPRDLGFARTVPTEPARGFSRGFWRDQVIRWLTRFADLRARFYGVGDADALKQELLQAQLTDINPDTQKLDLDKYLDRLEAKLTEFQAWWAAHQNDPVQLPTPEAAPATSPSPAPTP